MYTESTCRQNNSKHLLSSRHVIVSPMYENILILCDSNQFLSFYFDHTNGILMSNNVTFRCFLFFFQEYTLSPSPENKMSEFSKFKVFADDNFKCSFPCSLYP